jgi:hypothetical protein
MKHRKIKEELLDRLSSLIPDHKWESGEYDDLTFVKFSFLTGKSSDSEHYEVSINEQSKKFWIELHWENKTYHGAFEQFIDQNKGSGYTKELQEWQKPEYYGLDLKFYMLKSPDYSYSPSTLIDDISKEVINAYNRFNKELVTFYKDKGNYKKMEPGNDKYAEIIRKYLDYIDNNELDEAYKWKTVAFFRNNWSTIDATQLPSFMSELMKMQINLILQQYQGRTLNDLAINFPHEIIQLLNYIFDEGIELKERYHYFYDKGSELVAKLQQKLNTETTGSKIREETFAFFLTCNNPEKYYFYRDNYYKKFTEFLDEKPEKAGKKYFHYLDIIRGFNENIVKNNNELINSTTNYLSKQGLQLLENKNILAQSIVYINFGIEEKETKVEKKQNDKTMNQINHPLNQILYGPPGTGKTYNTILKAAQIIESDNSIDDYNEALEIFQKNLHNRIEFITFHQSYSYEDFIQGLRPDVENGGELSFEKKDGIFKIVADRALKKHKRLT